MIVIDSEFQSLIPPLSDDEYEGLEKSLVENGYQDWREPIITWNGTVIDGHNRYRICDEHGIKFRTMEMEFESRDAAKIWIIKNQAKERRNLSKYDRSTLVLKLEPLYAAEAKRRQGTRTDLVQNSAPSSDTGKTVEKLAKLAGVSRDTIRKVKVIETEAAKGNESAIEARTAVRSGEKSINKAYGEIRPKICTVCGKPIKDGDCYAHDPNKHKACASTQTELNRGRRGGRKAGRVLTKPQYADDGRRICSICGKPIDEGGHYQDKLNMHYKCGLEHYADVQRKYRERKRLENNITIGDVNEVIEHSKAELKRQLMLDVDSAWSNLHATLDRYESMGITVTDEEYDRICSAIEPIVSAIQEMSEE